MRLKKSWLWPLAASIVLSLAVPLALGGLGQFKLIDRLSWWAALLFTLLMVVSWWFNSWRIRMLLRVGGYRVSWREAVLTTASGRICRGLPLQGEWACPPRYLPVSPPGNRGPRGRRPGGPHRDDRSGILCHGDAPGRSHPVVRGRGQTRYSAPGGGGHACGAGGRGDCLGPLGRHYRRICIGVGRQMARCPGWPATVTAWPGPRSSVSDACASYRTCHGPSTWPSF